MRLPTRLFASVLLVSMLLVSAIGVLAQDNPPPTPFIPVATQPGSGGDAAPTLDAPIFATPTADSSTSETGDTVPAEETPAEVEATPAPPVDQPPAQANQCPIQVQEAFTATELICTDLLPGIACIGNGVIQAQQRTATETFAFAQPGDRTEFTSLNDLTLQTLSSPNQVWAVVEAQAPFSTRAGNGSANATLVAFGDVSLTNTGDNFDPNFLTASVLAQQGLNVRRTPDERGVVVYQLKPTDEVIVTGRTIDDQWVRIVIPNAFAATGWVYAPYMDVPGGIVVLPIVTVDSELPQLEAPEFGPMQAFTLRSTQYPPECDATPDSGLLIQSPDGLADAILMRINGVRIELNGSIFVQAQPSANLQIDVLEGEAVVSANGSSVTANTGNAVTVLLTEDMQANGTPNVAAYDQAAITPLPTRLLPRPFGIASASGAAAPASTGDTSAPDTTTPPEATTCVITASDAPKNIRSGPGVDYPTVGTLETGQTAIATGQATDSFNFAWYQIEQGWVRFDTVDSSMGCIDLPEVTTPSADAVPTAVTTEEATAIGSLTSSVVGDVCAAGEANVGGSSNGEDLALKLGGDWQATAGTQINVSVSGGLLRGEFGDYIRISTTDGAVLAQSGDSQMLSYIFESDTAFALEFSAANGDIVQAVVTCGP
ncbi:MAG: SH3 domain-containing protein [Anaerolineae bacterium]|nr:SH3 domain-containing protein [Anaerolineae bacterium]